MKRFMITAACLTLAAGAVYAAKLNKEQNRLENCGVVLDEVTNMSEHSPRAFGEGRVRRRISIR
jgi:hypothetical protein